MRKAILLIGLFFANCNANEKLFKLHFEEIDYTYDSGWKVAYSMKIYKSGLLIVGEGRWSKTFYSGKISESKLKALDSLLMLAPFKQYDSLYEAENEDQSSYKLVIPNFNNDSVKVFVYGNAAPRLLDSISNVLRSLKENTELHTKDTTLVFLSLQNFYPLPVKKTE